MISKKVLLKWAIKKSLGKLAPARFSYGSDNDFYVPVLYADDVSEGILIDSFNGQTVRGRKWDGSKFETTIELAIDSLHTVNLEITHFYGWQTIKYETLIDFCIGEITLLKWRNHLNERVKQSQFNARTKFRHDRIFVLKKLIETRIDKAVNTGASFFPIDNFASSLIFFEMVYGRRAFAHPSFEEELVRFGLLLQSLAETGDLELSGKNQFRLSPKALSTIASYEQSERMHDDSVRHNNRILWLTIFLALATIIQALVASHRWWNGVP